MASCWLSVVPAHQHGKRVWGKWSVAIKRLHLVVTARHVAMPKLQVGRWNHCMCWKRRRSSVSSSDVWLPTMRRTVRDAC